MENGKREKERRKVSQKERKFNNIDWLFGHIGFAPNLSKEKKGKKRKRKRKITKWSVVAEQINIKQHSLFQFSLPDSFTHSFIHSLDLFEPW